jgi:hypothetical protein
MSAVERAVDDLDRALPPGRWMTAAEMDLARVEAGHSLYAWRAARGHLRVRARRLPRGWCVYRDHMDGPPWAAASFTPARSAGVGSPANASDISAVVEHARAARSRAIGAALREHGAEAIAVLAVAMALVVAWVYAT